MYTYIYVGLKGSLLIVIFWYNSFCHARIATLLQMNWLNLIEYKQLTWCPTNRPIEFSSKYASNSWPRDIPATHWNSFACRLDKETILLVYYINPKINRKEGVPVIKSICDRDRNGSTSCTYDGAIAVQQFFEIQHRKSWNRSTRYLYGESAWSVFVVVYR